MHEPRGLFLLLQLESLLDLQRGESLSRLLHLVFERLQVSRHFRVQHLLELSRSLLLLTSLALKLQLDVFLFFEDLQKLSLPRGISICDLLHHAFNRIG